MIIILFGVLGAIMAVWGCLVALRPRWAISLMGPTVTGRQLTPRFVRFIGCCLCAGGLAIVVLTVTGVVPATSP